MTRLVRRVWNRLYKRAQLTSHAARADGFLTSYPKSGRTWFRFILSHYFASTAHLPGQVNLHSMFGIVPNFDLDPVRGIPAFRSGDRRDLPMILVSHLSYRPTLFLRRPVIFMVRDPRDVIVSAYFHATRHKHRFESDISDFIDDEDQGMPAMITYLNGWARGLKGRRHYVLSYESLSADTGGETGAVLRFLNCNIQPDALERAVAAGQFEAMQQRERVEGIPAHDYDRSDTESLRMRRGQAGGFGDYLDKTQIARVEKLCAENLTADAKRLVARTGLDL